MSQVDAAGEEVAARNPPKWQNGGSCQVVDARDEGAPDSPEARLQVVRVG